MATIEVRDVRKAFGNDGVLDGVDLEIGPGETTVLMGPNGSGKTVLLSCLAGGLHSDEGTIDVLGDAPADARDRLSFLQQDALAIPNLSGRQTARFYADLHPRSTGRWRDLLERFDLDALDRQVRDYSGGMTRKLELAVTLDPDVPVYLLDEPTTDLDMNAVDTLHAILRERVDDGNTVVLASHLPGDARSADRLVFLVGGEIVADGSPEGLLAEVPPVVRFRGSTPPRVAEEYLRRGRTFERGEVAVGFLEPDATRDAVADATGTGSVEQVEPTYADLFNYHVHVARDRS